MSPSRLVIATACLAVASAAWGAPPPAHIVSLNFCTDQLLLALVPPDRIASLTWLAGIDGEEAQRALAMQLPSNHGSAEEVLAAHPDLVLAGRYTTATTRALLERVGIRVVEVDAAQDWDGIRKATRDVAAAVGEVARGEALLSRMDAQLAQVRALRPVEPVRAIGWSGASEDVPGTDTLFNAIVEAAGAVNLAARPSGMSGFDLEQVLRLRPQLLLRGTSHAGGSAVRSGVADHPALRALPGLEVIEYPESAWACGVPSAADHALELARRLRALPTVKHP
jgi:iron complex transport system substrate-binding protein